MKRSLRRIEGRTGSDKKNRDKLGWSEKDALPDVGTFSLVCGGRTGMQ